VNKRSWVVVCTFCAIIASLATWRASTASGDEWQPISQEELKMASLPEARERRRWSCTGKWTATTEGRHMNSITFASRFDREGRKYANVEIPFFKETGTVLGIKARSIRADVRSRNLMARFTNRRS